VIDEERYDIDVKVAKNDKKVRKTSAFDNQFSMMTLLCSVSTESNG